MKLKIYDENSVNETDDKQLFVRLEKHNRSDDIILTVVDKNGIKITNGNLLAIDQDIKGIVLQEGINNNIPLKTDLQDVLLFITRSEYKDICKDQIMESIFHEAHASADKEQKDNSVKH